MQAAVRSALAILRSEHEPGLRPGYTGLLVRQRANAMCWRRVTHRSRCYTQPG